MTIWVLKQTLSPLDEEHIFAREHLILPFDGLPDLTHLTGQPEAQKLLRALYPAEPPEAIRRRVERFWHQFSNLQKEDLIAVALPHSKEVVLANVTGHYCYEVGDKGGDIHLVPVQWYEKRIPLAKFAKYKDLFAESTPPMWEVQSTEARVALRDHLPHSYNRFAKWKWVMMIFFALSLLHMLQGAIGKM